MVEHTRHPRRTDFEMLLEAGDITQDYIMHQKDPARKVVRHHGFPFKLGSSVGFDALFDPPRIYEL